MPPVTQHDIEDETPRDDLEMHSEGPDALLALLPLGDGETADLTTLEDMEEIRALDASLTAELAERGALDEHGGIGRAGTRAQPAMDGATAPRSGLSKRDPTGMIDYYLMDVQRFSLLAPAEEIALGERLRKGWAAERRLAPQQAPKASEIRELQKATRAGRMAERRLKGARVPAEVRRDLMQTVEAGRAAEARLDQMREPTAEERRELERAIEDSEQASMELVKRNLRFVISVAKKFQHRGMGLEDLIQEGNLGLITAARKFDLSHGVKFVTYAIWWIRQCVLASLAENGRSVRVPLNRTADLANLMRARDALMETLKREPTEAELARVTDLTLDTVRSLSVINAPELHLDASAGPDTEQTIGERLQLEARGSVEARAEQRCLHQSIDTALDGLDARDAQVLRLYFGLDGREHTLEEIGKILFITRERVRQLRDRAVDRLRNGGAAGGLKSFHDD